MTKADKALVILLRCSGVGSLFALLAVVVRFPRMVATHRWLGLGEMPTGAVVEYLARSVSAFYALFGALFLVVASDLERYRPVVVVCLRGTSVGRAGSIAVPPGSPRSLERCNSMTPSLCQTCASMREVVT